MMLRENRVRIVLIAGVAIGVVTAMGVTDAVSASIGQGDNYGQAISYIAFCVERGVDE